MPKLKNLLYINPQANQKQVREERKDHKREADKRERIRRAIRKLKMQLESHTERSFNEGGWSPMMHSISYGMESSQAL